MPYVELWVEILDELISWEISLFTTIWATHGNGKFPKFERAVVVLLMKVIADSLAMRELILAGFDAQARVLLRSAGEHLELLVAVIDDPQLADQFVLSDTPERAWFFWSQHLAKGEIRKKMKAAWSTFFRGEAEDTAKWFSNWGNGWVQRLSGMTHPSMAGGFMSGLPPKTKYTLETWPGFFGDRSDFSVDTIHC